MSKINLIKQKLMEYKRKDQILFWSLILLTLLNIAALTTICYHKMNRPFHRPPHHMAAAKSNHSHGKKADKYDERTQKKVNRHLKKALKLTQEQADIFLDLQKTHFVESGALLKEMRTLKSDLFQEVKKTSANKDKLDSIAEKIGDNQADLEKAHIKHILEMKTVCDKKQATKLLGILENSPLVRRPHHGPPPPHHRRGKHHKPPHHPREGHQPPHHHRRGHHDVPPPPPPPRH